MNPFESSLKEISSKAASLDDIILVCSNYIRYSYQTYFSELKDALNEIFFDIDLKHYISIDSKPPKKPNIRKELSLFKLKVKSWADNYPLIAFILTEPDCIDTNLIMKFEKNKFILVILSLHCWKSLSHNSKLQAEFKDKITLTFNTYRNAAKNSNLHQYDQFEDIFDLLSKIPDKLDRYKIEASGGFAFIRLDLKLDKDDLISDDKFNTKNISIVPNKRRHYAATLIEDIYKLKSLPNENNISVSILDQKDHDDNSNDENNIDNWEEETDCSDLINDIIDLSSDNIGTDNDESDDLANVKLVDTSKVLNSVFKKSDFMRNKSQAKAIVNKDSKSNTFSAFHSSTVIDSNLASFISKIVKSMQHNYDFESLIIFLSIILGRSIERILDLFIDEKIQFTYQDQLKIKKSHRYKILISLTFPTHQIKLDEQDDKYGKLLPTSTEIQFLISHDYRYFQAHLITTADKESVMKAINAKFKAYLPDKYFKLRKPENLIQFTLTNSGIDATSIKWVQGCSMQHQADMTYLRISNHDIAKLVTLHISKLNQMINTFSQKKFLIKAKVKAAETHAISTGSRLQIKSDKFNEILKIAYENFILLTDTKEYPSLIDQHNKSIPYLWLLFLLCTGARPASDKVKWSDICLVTKTVVINDKKVRSGSSERVIILPELFSEVLHIYINRLNLLYEKYKNGITVISKNAKIIKDKIFLALESPVFFKLDNSLYLIPVKSHDMLTIAHNYLGKRPNFARHYLKTYLTKAAKHKHIIHGWFGHESIGIETFSIQSDASINDLKEIAILIDKHYRDIIFSAAAND